MRNPILAGILSFLIPGVGQMYNGRIAIGIIWLAVALTFGVAFWIGSVGILGLAFHAVSGWCAYSFAKDNPVRELSSGY